MTRFKHLLAPSLAIVLLVVAVVIAFGPLVRAGFTDWDDQDTIWANPHVKSANASDLAHYWRHPEGELYIPMTYTVWIGLAHLGERTGTGELVPIAAIYHGANVVVHALSAVGAFLLLRRLLKRDWPACAGALLFALHPVQTESIAWASGMKDVLCGFFVILALWQYVAWVQDHTGDTPEGLPRRGGWIHYAIAILALILAMLSKPTAVVAPVLAMLIDALWLRHSPRLALRALWPWFLAIVPCVIWTKAFQPAWLGAHVPILLRPLVALDALAFYVQKIVWPVNLGIDYGRNFEFVQKSGWLWLTWIVPVALAAAPAWNWRRWRAPACAGLIAVAGVLPVLGFVPFEFQTHSTVADHYLYLPMLGTALAGGWLLAQTPNRAAFHVAALTLALLGLRSLDQTRHWHDSRALFSHALAVNPRSAAAMENLGVLHGYEAEMSLAKAQILAEQRDGVGAELEREKAENELAEAERHFARLLELEPGCASALHSRAVLRAGFAKHEDAVADLRLLIDELPRLRADERELYTRDHDLLGRELLLLHRPAEALACFETMLKLVPSDRAAARGREKALALRQHSPATQPTAATPPDPAVR